MEFYLEVRKQKGNKVENEFGWSRRLNGGRVANRLRKFERQVVSRLQKALDARLNNLNFIGVTPQEDKSGSGTESFWHKKRCYKAERI